MNRTRLDAVLTQLRWSQRTLAGLTGYSLRTIARWQTVPAPIAEWLEAMAAYLRDHPAPMIQHNKPRTRRAA